jgi:hypothetical protein
MAAATGITAEKRTKLHSFLSFYYIYIKIVKRLKFHIASYDLTRKIVLRNFSSARRHSIYIFLVKSQGISRLKRE